MMVDDEQKLQDAQRDYLNFLDDEEDQGVYSARVRDMVTDGNKRVLININDLRRKHPRRAEGLWHRADEEIFAFNRALKEYVSSVQPDADKADGSYHIGFDGVFGDRFLTPRSLTSKFIGSLLCVEGIVTKVSLVRPQVVCSVHYCPATKKMMERKYADINTPEGVPNSSAYPTKDDDGNLLETEFGLSVYKDHQTITLQEKPENSPAGQLPRSVDIICEDDLVDLCKPGDRVKVVASYRCLPTKNGGFTTGTFQAALIANNIQQLSKEADLSISREELNMCKKLAKDSDIFELLSRSLAPSIHGHSFVKKAILCLLLGGTEKKLLNGTRLRGDINILLIGDPSVAKSQLLRYVLLIAPRAIPTTGRGSSGVGLTAAVTTDQETGERKLEAGAMVLADRGVVCIDEFDKMSDIDRTAIHEVMEQGRVTISKAGIHASLNARCSVLAAANPVYGKYDQHKTPMENIGLQDSLLTRFDLLFVMLDNIDKGLDKTIADHVVRMHRYRNPLEQDGEVSTTGNGYRDNFEVGENIKDKQELSVFERYDASLHKRTRSKDEKVLSIEFMRKYIHIAKCLKPKLTERACEVIANEYSRLRTQEIVESNVARTQPVTVRTLETLIRLATAHAKARLSNTVTANDAELAIELVQYAYFKTVLEKKKRKRSVDDDTSSKDERDVLPDSSSDIMATTKRHRVEDDTMSIDTQSSPKSHRRKGKDQSTREDEHLSTIEEESSRPSKKAQISAQRLVAFKSGTSSCFREIRDQSCLLVKLVEYVNSKNTENFTDDEVSAAIEHMTEENQVMLADGVVFLI